MMLYRAAILNPLSEQSWEYFPDGGLLVNDGNIVAVGSYKEIAEASTVEPQELSGVIVPGFVDVHIHWVQHSFRGQFQASLLDWLNTFVWKEEAKFQDEDYARQQAQNFFSDTLRAGTTMGMAYSSVHEAAARIAAQCARDAGCDWIVGNSLMDTGAPQALLDHNVADPGQLHRLYHDIGVPYFAVTPRFALNCTAELLKALGRFVKQTNCFVQTHLSESSEEVAQVCRCFADCHDYTDVYDRAGLLTPKTVLGHCIHLCDREWSIIAERGSWVAHCPSSNEMLGSGRMDLDKLRRYGIPWALGSDVGAGPSHSMLHVMQRFLVQHRQAGVTVDVKEALYRASLAGARCLGRDVVAGNLQAGKRADFVLLPAGESAPTDPAQWLQQVLEGEAVPLENRPLATWLSGQKVLN